MRFVATLNTDKKPAIYEICDAIYRCLESGDVDYCKKVHDEGYWCIDQRENRCAKWSFKPFVFSHPYVTSDGKIKVKIGSPIPEFTFYLIEGKNRLNSGLITKDTRIEIQSRKPFTNGGMIHADIFMISPLVLRMHGYSNGYANELPNNERLSKILTDNLQRKANAFNISVDKYAHFIVRKVWDVSKFDKSYKKEVLPSFTFKMSVSSDPVLFMLAYDAGIGSKNALGFGMIEIDVI